MNTLKISIDEEEFSRIIQALRTIEGKSEESIFKSAVNSTAKYAKKQLEKQTKKVYGGEAPGGISARDKIEKGRVKNPTATIIFKSEQPDIRKHIVKYSGPIPTKTVYRNGKRAKFPIYVQQLRNKALQQVQGAGWQGFMIKCSNGHIAVVSHTSKGSKKLKTWMGSSDPIMVRNDKVYGTIKEDFESKLLMDCEKALAKALK